MRPEAPVAARCSHSRHKLASVTLVTALLVSGCADLFQREHPTNEPPPVVNRAATTSTVLADDLQLLRARLLRS